MVFGQFPALAKPYEAVQGELAEVIPNGGIGRVCLMSSSQCGERLFRPSRSFVLNAEIIPYQWILRTGLHETFQYLTGLLMLALGCERFRSLAQLQLFATGQAELHGRGIRATAKFRALSAPTGAQMFVLAHSSN